MTRTRESELGGKLLEAVDRLAAINRVAPGSKADFGIEVGDAFYRVAVERGEPRRMATP